jgi:hypothetical protein
MDQHLPVNGQGGQPKTQANQERVAAFKKKSFGGMLFGHG